MDKLFWNILFKYTTKKEAPKPKRAFPYHWPLVILSLIADFLIGADCYDLFLPSAVNYQYDYNIGYLDGYDLGNPMFAFWSNYSFDGYTFTPSYGLKFFTLENQTDDGKPIPYEQSMAFEFGTIGGSHDGKMLYLSNSIYYNTVTLFSENKERKIQIFKDRYMEKCFADGKVQLCAQSYPYNPYPHYETSQNILACLNVLCFGVNETTPSDHAYFEQLTEHYDLKKNALTKTSYRYLDSLYSFPNSKTPFRLDLNPEKSHIIKKCFWIAELFIDGFRNETEIKVEKGSNAKLGKCRLVLSRLKGKDKTGYVKYLDMVFNPRKSLILKNAYQE